MQTGAFQFIPPEQKKQLTDQIHAVMGDIQVSSWIDAYMTTARYYNENNALPGAKRTQDRYDNLRVALDHVAIDGLALEFGVATGKTTNCMADHRPQMVFHGFDAFEGIPEPWHAHPANKYSQGGKMPEVRPNVRLHKGYYDKTAEPFAKANPGPVAFMHIDCDLYSSTKTAFDAFADRIVPGTVIVFDEYWNYPSWELHEHKAFMELVKARKLAYEFISFVPHYTQVAVRITG